MVPGRPAAVARGALSACTGLSDTGGAEVQVDSQRFGRGRDMDDDAADRYAILTTAAGTSHRQDALSRCDKGQTVHLVRDPANVHDRNAIEVHSDEMIGFIPKDEAEILALYIDYFGPDDIEASIKQLTGGTTDKPTIGIILEIRVSELLYNSILEDPESIREFIVREKRMAEIDSSGLIY